MVGMGQNMVEHNQLLVLSRAISIILILLYVTYLVFTLRTHASLFEEEYPDSDEEEAITKGPSEALGPVSAIAWLAISLTCVTFCTLPLLSSIQLSSWKADTPFLGLILFPFLGNLTDYTSACWVAWKHELDITILVTIGSSMQIMLFTWPFLVLLGWLIDKPMAFNLDAFEAAVIFLSVFIASGLVRHGRSDYFVGAMCIAL